jgi:tetratricopeptide (TPR) repeat protein
MRLILLPLLLTLVSVAHAALAPADTDLVRALLRDRKFAEAEAALLKLTVQHPVEPDAWAGLGDTQLRQDKAEEAVKSFEKAVELAPTTADYHRQLGDAYGRSAQKAGVFSKLGFAKKCKAAYEKAVELDPTNLNARFSLMSYFQQAPSMVGGGMDKAYAQAAEIKKLDAARGRVAYANLYVAEKKYAEAFNEFEDVLRSTPDNYAALFQIGRLAALSGERLDRGLETLKQCLAATPPAGQPGHDAANWRLGNILEKKGDKAGAKAAYEAALAVNAKFAQAIDALKKLQ